MSKSYEDNGLAPDDADNTWSVRVDNFDTDNSYLELVNVERADGYKRVFGTNVFLRNRDLHRLATWILENIPDDSFSSEERSE